MLKSMRTVYTVRQDHAQQLVGRLHCKHVVKKNRNEEKQKIKKND